jgi:hypothetical protein
MSSKWRVWFLTLLAGGLGCQNSAPSSATASVNSSGGPQLYADPSHESPVRGDPGDVVMLGGAGFTSDTVVVYQALGDTTQTPVPSSVPTSQSSTTGTITPLTIDQNAVRVVLPDVMKPGQSYALWAVASPQTSPAWSAPALINDARPQWIAPGPLAPEHASALPSPSPLPADYTFEYLNADRTGMSRRLVVVGRNLQPALGATTQVRFTGGSTDVTIPALSLPSPVLARYVAQVILPPGQLPLGTYSVSVSRDGTSWVPMTTQLVIVPDPTPTSVTLGPTFADPMKSGPCLPDDGLDDTLCIARAIEAAKLSLVPGQQANVIIPAGTWTLANCTPNDKDALSGADALVDTFDFAPSPSPSQQVSYTACWPRGGIPVPDGVSLIADPNAATKPTIEALASFDLTYINYNLQTQRCGAVGSDCSTNPCCQGDIYSEQWAEQCLRSPDGTQAVCALPSDSLPQQMFSLYGNNFISGLHFYHHHDSTAAAGKSVDNSGNVTNVMQPSGTTLQIYGSDISIDHNFFEDGRWGVYVGSINPENSQFLNQDLLITSNTIATWKDPILLELTTDLVIRGNTLWPGATPEYEKPAAISTAGSLHSLVVSNQVDGSVTTYSDALHGWRSGMFFDEDSPQEEVLVAANTIKCSGTRLYWDGEAIGIDANGGYAGFKHGTPVLASPSDPTTQVTVQWPGDTLLTPDMNGNYPYSSFIGRWLEIDQGPGLGQTRKITDAEITASGQLTMTVSPKLDVVPAPGQSKILVNNQAWHFDIVDNVIDNTVANCSNIAADHASLTVGNAGVIEIGGPAADLAIEGNQQSDSYGIYLDAQMLDGGYQWLDYFTDVRGNSINGSFGFSIANTLPSWNIFGSGIVGAADVPLTNGSNTTDVFGFGLSISHNQMVNAEWTAKMFNESFVGDGSAIALGAPQSSGQSLSPGWVDTSIFLNAMSAPPLTSGDLAFYFGYSTNSAAISNGGALSSTNGQRNYPQSTLVCCNVATGFGAGVVDWPDTSEGEASTLVSCEH